MAAIEGLREVELEPRHLEDACALVDEAGWNETRDDWEMMLEAGHAFGFEDDRGKLVASALTLPYGDSFGWISMVLVTAEWRRRGIASYLLGACIADHEDAGRIPILDATPAGEEVYRGLGFESHFTIQRWECENPRAAESPETGVRRASSDDLSNILAYDRETFEGNRSALLSDICLRRGAQGWVLEQGNGYLLSREGRRARQLGPLCADTDEDARALMAAALDYFDEPVFVDVPDRHAALVAMLQDGGFTAQRPFRRMFKGEADGFGDIARTYALAGPELG